MTAMLAEVYAVIGENANAIELLDGLLSRPGGVTVASLKLDPAMDRLRDDPNFQILLKKCESRILTSSATRPRCLHLFRTEWIH